jgi:tol-pal system protein YbgF
MKSAFRVILHGERHTLNTQEFIMKIQRCAAAFALVAMLASNSAPAFAVSKEMVTLQTQVQALQDQMARMQQSFDERMGVMKSLMDQNTDNINKVTAAIAAMNDVLQKQQSVSATQAEQLSGQIQALNDSIDELKARMAKVSKQMDDMQATQQSAAASQAAQQAQAAALAAAPPPDVLYNNGLRDYNAGKNDLASQEFSDYIKFYPNTDLAGNSYFYLAELQYKQGNYQAAITNYDLVIQNFPSGNKAASAELKKGFAQIESGQQDAGAATLHHVVQRYPRTNEALQAKEKLRKLGTTPAKGQ